MTLHLGGLCLTLFPFFILFVFFFLYHIFKFLPIGLFPFIFHTAAPLQLHEVLQ